MPPPPRLHHDTPSPAPRANIPGAISEVCYVRESTADEESERVKETREDRETKWFMMTLKAEPEDTARPSAASALSA